MKFLLVDGYSLLYRAFFSSPPLTTREGTPTGAVYGFARMLLRLLDEHEPQYVLVAMESHGPTVRHDSNADYKANRAAMPDDLRSQTASVREFLDGLSISHYEHDKYEGDDVMGTMARNAAAKGLDVIIVTGDNDMLQLVDDRVSALLTRRGVSDLDCFTPGAVQAKYGFDPILVPDFKGLRGDTSDNIPGVPGIGDKTAMSLIGKYGSLEKIYENLEDVKPPRIAGLLTEHREVAFHSRDLARIVTDLPINVEVDACRYQELTDEQREKALTTVRLFEFKSMIPRFSPKKSGADGTAEGAESAASEDVELTAQACEASYTASAEEARQWLQDQGDKPVAILLDGWQGLVLAGESSALYFGGKAQEIKSWLEDEKQPKIAFDSKTLKLEFNKCDIRLSGPIEDALLMAYLLDPTRQHHPLDHLAKKYLSRSLPEPEKESRKKAAASLFEEDQEEELSERRLALCASACALHSLPPVLRIALRAIEEEKIYDEIEQPLVDVLVSMEECGMLLDIPHLRKLGTKLEAEAARLQGEIWEVAGEEFNVGSTKQLQTILFEKLGLAKGRTTKTGFSTDVHTLERLAEEHEIVRKILDYRGITKLKSTYVDALLKGHDTATNRIHTHLNQTGAVSGRLSSTDPNLQNVPIRTEQGRQIRKAFIAPPGWVLLAADYSQVELRILAHITGDEPLVEAFRTDEDVHSRTAADLFDVPVDQVDSEMRRKAKMTNYAIAYGVSGFGLAKQLGTGTAGEATEFIKRYFEALPGVKKYIDDTLQVAREQGYIATLIGRRRPLPEIRSPRAPERAAAERTAINHPIQGTCADLMKLAMLAVHRELREGAFKARMTMQVHDELVFEVPEDEVKKLAALVERLMCQAPLERIPLEVPLEVEIETGLNWDDTEELKD
jgi:DNA polymerase-1